MTSYLLQIYKPTIGGVPKPSGRPHRMQGEKETVACAIETSKAKGVAIVVVSRSHTHGRHVIGSATDGTWKTSATRPQSTEENDMPRTTKNETKTTTKIVRVPRAKKPETKTIPSTRGVWTYAEIAAMDDAQIKRINTLARKRNATPAPDGFLPETETAKNKYHRLYGAFLLGARVYAPYPRECGLTREQGIKQRAKIRSLLMELTGIDAAVPMTDEKVTERAVKLEAGWAKKAAA